MTKITTLLRDLKSPHFTSGQTERERDRRAQPRLDGLSTGQGSALKLAFLKFSSVVALADSLANARELDGLGASEIVALKGHSTNPLVNRFSSDANTRAQGHCQSFVSSYLQSVGHQGFYPRGTLTGAPNLHGRLATAGEPWKAHNPFPGQQLPNAPTYQLTAEQTAWWNSNMKEGDPVFFRTNLNGAGVNDQGHVVLFAGIKGGQPTFIGANNVEADGKVFKGEQRVTEVPYSALMSWLGGAGFAPVIASAYTYGK